MVTFETIIDRIKEIFNISKDKDIADKLGVSNQVFANWKMRNKIPYEKLITLCLQEDIDLKYLINGEKNKNFIKKINFKEELHKLIEDIKEEKAEIYYHLIKAELLKEKL